MRRARSIVEIKENPLNVAELLLPNLGLEEFPEEIFLCTNLRKLDLSQNKLRHVPARIGELLHLERLDLNLNPLESLPTEIGLLSSLRRLHLDHCKLPQLPGTISGLSQLRVLRMDHNPISQLPASISACDHLEEISLKSGHLLDLPEAFASLRQLHYLDLGHNRLERFPRILGQLPLLRHLELSGNPFTNAAEPRPLAKWIFQYYADRDRQKLEGEDFRTGLDVLLHDMEQVTQHDFRTVFATLESPFPFVREQAVEVMESILLDPFSVEQHPKTIVFAGKFGAFNMSEAKLKLEEAGYRVQGNVPPQGAVLIVGMRPGRKLVQALDKEMPIGVLSHVERFLERNQGRFIKGATEGELVVENLRGMLESGDKDSESLATSLLQKGGMPPDLAGLVATRWIFSEDEAKAKRLEQLLRQNGFQKLISRIQTQSRIRENLNYSWMQYLTRLSRFPELDLGELVEEGMKRGLVPQKEAFQAEGIDLRPVIERSIQKGELALLNYQLGQFPIEITDFQELHSIYLMGNSIRNLPPEIGRIAGLRKLFLNSNLLEGLPEEIGSLSNLQELNLGSNRIKVLPQSLTELEKLKQLELWSNPITKLPDRFSKLSSLEELDLGECPLGHIPEVVWTLPKLRVLNVHGCKLSELPSETPAFQSLQVLNLGINDLKAMPDWLDKLHDLKVLVINKNRFSKLPEVLVSSPSLKELWVSNDLDWEQAVEVLKAIPKLQRLVVSGGQKDLTFNSWIRQKLPGVYVLQS